MSRSVVELLPRDWVRALRGAAAETGKASVVAGVARLVGDLPTDTTLGVIDPASVPPPPAGVARDVDLVGAVHEALIDGSERRRAGAHYTPAALARRLTAIAIDGSEPRLVCDPACGGGAFLLAAARQLHACGWERARAIAVLRGFDIDPLAVATTEATLALWAGTAPARDHIRIGDALDPSVTAHLAGRCDVVIGNPPFLNQLERGTARTAPEAARARDTFGDAANGYADAAWLFLLAGLELLADNGCLVLVQPQSLLAARDAAAVRRRALSGAALEGLWIAGEPVFTAAVRVCAPVLRRTTTQPARVRRWRGADVVAARSARFVSAPTWAPMSVDVPSAAIRSARSLGYLATATAGFRDQFYGLVPFVDDGAGDHRQPLVTCGLIEPGRSMWGRRGTRFAGRRLAMPAVDVTRLEEEGPPSLARWVGERLVPKVVVATQTRVVEAAVDERGEWVPSTPVIAVHSAPDDLWHVAAVLLAPAVTAWALRTYGGTALADGAVKLAARQVLEVPLPNDRDAWTRGAELVRVLAGQHMADDGARRATLVQLGATMNDAYGVSAGNRLLSWWTARLPFHGNGSRHG